MYASRLLHMDDAISDTVSGIRDICAERVVSLSKVVAVHLASWTHTHAGNLWIDLWLVQEIQATVAALSANLAAVDADVASLSAQRDTATRRLRAASSLTTSLSFEADRWKDEKRRQEAELGQVFGTALAAAAAVTYLGPFGAFDRRALLATWLRAFAKAGLSVPDDWSVRTAMTSELELRSWRAVVGSLSDMFTSSRRVAGV
jgi:hypothetical protein